MKLPGSVHHIYDYLCVQTESCGFIINGVIVKDEENANYYPARRYISHSYSRFVLLLGQLMSCLEIVYYSRPYRRLLIFKVNIRTFEHKVKPFYEWI